MADVVYISGFYYDAKGKYAHPLLRRVTMQCFSQVQLAGELGIADRTLRAIMKKNPSVNSALKKDDGLNVSGL